MRKTLANVAKITLGLGVSVGFGYLAVRGLEWAEVADSLQGVRLPLVLLAVAFFILASFVRAYRWKLLFVRQRISTLRLSVIQNEGIGLNNLLPIRVASEAMQMTILTLRERIPAPTALATLGMERLIDVVASALILVAAFFLVPEMKSFKLYVWGAIGFALVAILLVRLIAWGGASGILKRFRFLSELALAVGTLEKQRVRLAASLLASVLYWVMVGITAWIVAEAFDLGISPVTSTLVITGTIFFATAVPAAPSAIGTFEAAVVYVLKVFDVDHAAAFGFAIIVHAVFFLPPTLIAIVGLPMEGVLSRRGVQRLRTGGATTGATT